jgi:hypothetical protein
MPGLRTHWWASRDLRRLIARCEFTAGGPIDTEELRYLRMSAEVLLHGPLDLCDDDRARVAQIHHDVLAALGQRAGARVEAP